MEAKDFTYPLEAVVGLVLLGLAAVLWRWSSDRRSRLWLGLYLALVGGNHLLIGLVNTATFLPQDIHDAWRPGLLAAYRVADVLQIAEPLPLALAVAALAHARLARWLLPALGAWTAVAAGVAAVTLAPLAVGTFSSALSPATLLMGGAVTLGSLGYLTVRHAREPRALRRDRLGDLTVALGTVVVTRIALTWPEIQGGRFQGDLVWQTALVALGLAAALGGVAVAVHRPAARRAVVHTSLRLAAAVAAVAAIWLLALEPALVPVIEGSFTYGARWLLFALLIGASIHRIGLLEVGVRGERLLWAGLVGTACAAATTVLWAVLAGVGGANPLSSLAASVAVAALLTAMLVHLSSWRPGGPSELRRRQLAIYRAHLEMESPAAELAELRARLAIGDEEARRLADAVAAESRGHAAPLRLEPGSLVAGRYRVEDLLGMGAFGRTFLAVDTVGGGRVVLKELVAARGSGGKALPRFRAEVGALLAAEHPNLVRFRDLERTPGGHVLVLDHVEGATLRQRLRSGPLSPKEARRLGEGLLAGLAALHAKGIAHGDVKPENVVVRRNGQPVLLDFGAARVIERRTRQDRVGLGTEGYLAPERSRGGPPTVAADLYAAGVVLWEAMTGRHPPEGKLPPGAVSVLGRALADDPGKRWPDAKGMADALLARHA